MALQECGLNLNRVSRELQPHGSLEFPCAGYASHHTDRPDDGIPWHWHEEMEPVYIQDGQMILRTPASSIVLREGDLAAVNSNVLHHAAAAPEGTLRSLVFSPALITGDSNSAFAKKYMKPLISCSSFTGYQIAPDDRERIAGWFRCAFEALAGDHAGFEFTVRENLSRICFFLCQQFQSQFDREAPLLHQDDLRIKKMLDYVHRNFAGELALPEIAKAADVSERECLRCFQKTLQTSPMQYLLKYRIMQGAELLLTNHTDSISDIAVRCGFDSPSNFAKQFKRFYLVTPREYRKLHREAPAVV